jgi:HAD superfamily hydrolase (TIGR01509 family)
MLLPLPTGSFKAYLFDCDGTIADSMPLHYQGWLDALSPWRCTLTEERFYEWAGRPVPEIVEALNREQHLAMPVEEVNRRKEEAYLELLPQLKAVPEVLEHIEASYGRIPFAVVSGSPRASVVATLETLRLLDRFDTLVCGGDYSRGKPDPEPFLVAAQRLRVQPAACLVFEDAELGIRAATAAGMASVKVPSPQQRAAGRGRPGPA